MKALLINLLHQCDKDPRGTCALHLSGGLSITRVANQGLCLHEISIGLLEETVTRHLEGVSSPVDLGQHYKLPPCQPGPPPCSRPPIRASTSLPWLLHNSPRRSHLSSSPRHPWPDPTSLIPTLAVLLFCSGHSGQIPFSLKLGLHVHCP